MKTTKPFWSFVVKTETCWLWIGPQMSSGYGTHRGKLAHRRSFQTLIRPLKNNEHLHHTCCNRLCVNPDHLVPTTASEHIDSAPALNRNKTRCPAGHEYTLENTDLQFGRKDSVYRKCRRCMHKEPKTEKEIDNALQIGPTPRTYFDRRGRV